MAWCEAITRRGLLGKLAAFSALLLFRRPAQGEPDFDIAPEPPPVYTLEERLTPILAGRAPKQGRVTLTMPLHAEDGGTVPMQLDVESPMTEQDHVQNIYVIADPESRPPGFLGKPPSRDWAGAVEIEHSSGRKLPGAGHRGNERWRVVCARSRRSSACWWMWIILPVTKQ